MKRRGCLHDTQSHTHCSADSEAAFTPDMWYVQEHAVRGSMNVHSASGPARDTGTVPDMQVATGRGFLFILFFYCLLAIVRHLQ